MARNVAGHVRCHRLSLGFERSVLNHTHRSGPLVPEKFLAVLRCPSCRASGLTVESESLACPGCGRTYSFQSGVADLVVDLPLSPPRICEDPHYRRWVSSRFQAHDYFYDQTSLVGRVQRAGHLAVRRMAEELPEGLTLDLGYGTGAHYPYLRNPAQSFGLDIDQPSLERLKALYPDFFVVRGDAYNLPLKDHSVSCIVNVHNLEHMVFLDHALEEMARVLVQGGDVLIALPSEGSLLWEMGRRLFTARRFGIGGLDYRRALAIDHFNCIWQLDKAIKRHFRVVRRQFFPLRLPSFHFNLVVIYHCRHRDPEP